MLVRVLLEHPGSAQTFEHAEVSLGDFTLRVNDFAVYEICSLLRVLQKLFLLLHQGLVVPWLTWISIPVFNIAVFRVTRENLNDAVVLVFEHHALLIIESSHFHALYFLLGTQVCPHIKVFLEDFLAPLVSPELHLLSPCTRHFPFA